jgi:hypothetical protein
LTSADSKRLVIVGAGTASWIAAAAFKNFADYNEIILIEGSKPTVGVGEGTTPHFSQVLRGWLKSTDAEFFAETDSTVKLGVKYEGWGKEDYYNPIDTEFRTPPADIWPETIDAKRLYAVANNLPVCTSPFLKLCKNNQIPSDKETYAYHFDQSLVSAFFKKRLTDVKVINADVVDVVVADGKISKLMLSNGSEITADFYVDSTGFSRVLISKLGAKWIDWSTHLPLTSALAYSLPQDEIIKPYTSATTYTEGWHWTIPLQTRKGCGFLYNSSLSSKSDIELLLPKNAYDARTVQFTPGYLDRSFIGNCLTVGLASGFVEPLEATSIHSTIGQLFLWLKDFHSMSNNQHYIERLWIRHHKDYWNSVLDWIQLHYCNASASGKFWTHMANVEKTDKVKEILELIQVRLPRNSDLDNPYLIWQHSLTMNILQGNDLLSPDIAQQELELFNLHTHGEEMYHAVKPYIQGKESNVSVYR